MLELSASQGVEKIVATPHFYADDESVEHFLSRRSKALNELQNNFYEVIEKNIELNNLQAKAFLLKGDLKKNYNPKY